MPDNNIDSLDNNFCLVLTRANTIHVAHGGIPDDVFIFKTFNTHAGAEEFTLKFIPNLAEVLPGIDTAIVDNICYQCVIRECRTPEERAQVLNDAAKERNMVLQAHFMTE